MLRIDIVFTIAPMIIKKKTVVISSIQVSVRHTPISIMNNSFLISKAKKWSAVADLGQFLGFHGTPPPLWAGSTTLKKVAIDDRLNGIGQ